MAVEAGLDPSAAEIVTTADAQVPSAVEEIGPQNGVDVSLEGVTSPDDMLGAATPDQAAQEEVPEEKQEEVVEAAGEEPQKKDEELGARASKRVSEAVNRAKEAEVKLAEMQAQYQQQLAYMQYQMQQQMAAQQKAVEQQQEFYRKQAEIAAQRFSQEDDAKLTPAQRIEREWLQKAKEAAKAELSPELSELKNQLAAERQLRERALKAAQERKMLNDYKMRAETVNKNVLFKEFDPETVSKLSPKAQELLLTWGSAAGEEPEQAVQGLQQFLEDYHRAKLKAISQKKGGAQIKQSTIAPRAVPKTSNGSAKAPKVKFDFASNTWVQTNS